MNANNRFDDLVQAAAAIKSVDDVTSIDDCELSDEQLAALLRDNAPSLVAARNALAGHCHVEVEFSREWWDAQVGANLPLRSLARAFRVEFELHKRRGEIDKAVAAALDILRLSVVTRNGGLIVHLLTSISRRDIAINLLRRVRRDMNVDQCRRLISELLSAEAEAENFDAILARDKEWTLQVEFVEGKSDNGEFSFSNFVEEMNADDRGDLSREEWLEFAEAFDTAATALNDDPATQSQMVQQNDVQSLAMLRLLVVDLALRLYRQENGEYPESFDALTPNWLGNIPLDPINGKPMHYCVEESRSEENDFSLCCIGHLETVKFGSWFEATALGQSVFYLDIYDGQSLCGSDACCVFDEDENNEAPSGGTWGRLRSWWGDVRQRR